MERACNHLIGHKSAEAFARRRIDPRKLHFSSILPVGTDSALYFDALVAAPPAAAALISVNDYGAPLASHGNNHRGPYRPYFDPLGRQRATIMGG
jgi:hypothetical protein